MAGTQSSFGKRANAKSATAPRAQTQVSRQSSEASETDKLLGQFGMKALRWTGGGIIAFLIFGVVFFIAMGIAGYQLRGQHGVGASFTAGSLLLGSATLALNCAIYGGSALVAKEDRYNIRIALLAVFIAGMSLYLIFAASSGGLSALSWMIAVGSSIAAFSVWRRLKREKQKALLEGEPA